MESPRTHAHWSSRLTFILAAAGAAIGIGNLWKFPYVVGANGGGAFVILYLAAALLVAVPILVGEFLVGRRGQQSPPVAMELLARETGSSASWKWVGWMGVLAGFIILSVFGVPAGWMMAYAVKLISGEFTAVDQAGAEAAFAGLLASPGELIFWDALFIGVTGVIVALGVQRGIERSVKILMPALFAMMIGLVAYSIIEGDLAAALEFLFRPDFAKISPHTMLIAVGQAFFSIGVGMGVMMAYGAYLSPDISLIRSAFVVAAMDTAAAILAGLAIFPLVFGSHLNPGEGPGLILVTLPIAFGSVPGGAVSGSLFFLLIVFATLTSTIGVLEPIVAWTQERFGVSRARAAAFWTALCFLLSLMVVFSFNLWADVRPLGWIPGFADKSIFDVVDHLVSNLLLPLAGLLASLFVGWRVPRTILRTELLDIPEVFLTGWIVLLRFVVPASLAIMILTGIV